MGGLIHMKSSIACLGLTMLLVAAACGDDEEGASTTSAASTTGSSQGGGGAGATGGSASGGAGAEGGSGGMGTGGMGTGGMATGGMGSGGMAPFELTSPAFAEGEMIPQTHECENGGGDNVSPPLSWTPGPAGTKSYAIVMRDLDFQNGFLHWVIWDIPGNVTSLPAGIENTYQPPTPAGAKQAPFNGNLVGYFGPCSPNSVNTYELTVYAIDVDTIPGLDQQSTKEEAEDAILMHSLAEAKLSGES